MYSDESNTSTLGLLPQISSHRLREMASGWETPYPKAQVSLEDLPRVMSATTYCDVD